MIQCSSCGKVLEKVPKWLSGAQIQFVCNNCPNRQAKNIAFLSLEAEAPKVAKVEEDVEIPELEEEETED